MDYYQKYLKYKAKYIATQTGGYIADLKDIAIPPELQMLDDAFLPGFNVDKTYVEPLLAAAACAENSSEVIKFLQSLNNVSENGLCAKGDRLAKGQTKKTKEQINTDLKSMESKPDDDGRSDALKFFKTVEKIRNANVNSMKGNTDAQLSEFQTLDDTFLPGFNIDKEYVGHLLYFVLQSNGNSKQVLQKLLDLNNKLISVFKKKTGLNEKGNRMIQGKSFKGKEIKKDIENLLKTPPTFPQITSFNELQKIITNQKK
jgi:hypothetical protein